MNKVVIGLGFGDEGKGVTVDYLCKNSLDPLVIRFNGGHQAGHTVVHNGARHVFSNFGSGSFRGVPSYWSEYCTIDPVGIVNERSDLISNKTLIPTLFINAKCPVVTPYDKIASRKNVTYIENGTCGVGFGTTIQREEDHYHLQAIDLLYPSILEAKMYNIGEYYWDRYLIDSNTLKHELNAFYEVCGFISVCNDIYIVDKMPQGYSTKIFEGAQGLLLDQYFGFFPNVTRSNTGTKNISEMGEKIDELYLVTRAYQTRHGKGFMTNENLPHNILVNPKETNVENFQGPFRRTLLDVSLLQYAIEREEVAKKSCGVVLVITCLDHIVNEHRFTYKGDVVSCSSEGEFINKIKDILKINNVCIGRSESNDTVSLDADFS